PGNNAVVVLPTNLVITAIVSGFSNAVTNVTFYSGTTKLADDSSSPYSFAWTTVTPGSYTLQAVASDSGGMSATSAPVHITVQSNLPPSIAIINPANGTVFTAGTNVPVRVAASDSDGQVANVQFYANGAPIGASTIAPFNLTWPSVPLGTYDLTAVATDDHGAQATSGPVHIVVIMPTAPTVTSFAPAAGTVSSLTQVTVNFSEPVDGIDASDLLIDNLPASSVTGSNATYIFSFPQPPEGVVTVTWAANHGILDRQTPAVAF